MRGNEGPPRGRLARCRPIMVLDISCEEFILFFVIWFRGLLLEVSNFLKDSLNVVHVEPVRTE